MKKLLFSLLFAFAFAASAQNSAPAVDSAQLVVQRFLDRLNIGAIPSDSILYMETTICLRTRQGDTAILKRWFQQPNRFRAELWHGDTLQTGVITDGKEIFYEADRKVTSTWYFTTAERYYRVAPGYEFRTALYNWQANGDVLTYKGLWNFNGHQVHRILVEEPYAYRRYFFFEKESGLLFLIEETNEHSEYSNHQAYRHPSIHGYHEYYPLGNVLLPSAESYQMDGETIYHYTRYKYIPLNDKLFTLP
jgi:hypothetical protein